MPHDAATTTEIAPDATDASTTTDAAPCSRRSLLALLVVVATMRFAFAADRTIFHVVADEPANLGMARWLSQTGEWNMFTTATWRPGFALITAPLFWLFDDPTLLYRSALAANALLGGCAAAVLVRITERITPLGGRSALVVSGAIALSSASLSASAFAWSEPTITLAFLVCLLATLRCLDAPRWQTGVAALAAAGFGALAHGRLLPLLAVAAISVVAGSIAAGRLRLAGLFAGLAVGLAATVHVVVGVITDGVWESPSSINSTGSVIERLGRPVDVADAAIGQIWYLLAATFGIFGIGCIVLARQIVSDRNGDRAWWSTDQAILLGFALPLMAISIVFMTDRPRPDQAIYGRYNEAIVWPILAIGAGWLLHGLHESGRRTRLWTIGLTAVALLETGLLVTQLHGSQLRSGGAISMMIPGLQAFTGGHAIAPPLRVTLLAAGAMTAVVLAATLTQRRGIALGLVVVALIGTGAATIRFAGPPRNPLQQIESATGIVAVVPPDAVIRTQITPGRLEPVEARRDQSRYFFTAQWFLPDVRFVSESNNSVETPFVLAHRTNRFLREDGAEIIWRDPDSLMAVWRTTDTAP